MSLIYLRQAQNDDLPTIMAIIEQAKTRLKADGSPQWQSGYPDRATLQNDIWAQNAWVLMVDGQLAGTATLIVGDEPSYHDLREGTWHNQTDAYATIHRIAVAPQFAGQHLSHYIFSNLISLAQRRGVRNFRIDTHAINQRMQAVITSQGYVYRGKIYVNEPAEHPEDTLRWAYELNL